jgi:hypothetical protein
MEGVMKPTKHILLGVLASFLFAAGFAKAADRIDAVIQGTTFVSGHSDIMRTAIACTMPCDAPPPPPPGGGSGGTGNH